jgi:hypothetical protein
MLKPDVIIGVSAWCQWTLAQYKIQIRGKILMENISTAHHKASSTAEFPTPNTPGCHCVTHGVTSYLTCGTWYSASSSDSSSVVCMVLDREVV